MSVRSMIGDVRSPIPLAMLGGGVGSLMGDTHRRAIEASGDFELVAGCFSSDASRNMETARAIGLEPCRLYGDDQALLKGEATLPNGAQAVALLTPNFLHAAHATECLRAGLHVICEKPLTRTVEEAELLVDLAIAEGRTIAVTHTYTGYPAVRLARRMIEKGAIGDLRVVQVEYAQGWLATAVETSRNRQAMWRTNPELSGGGAIADIGSHAGNLAEFVSGLTIEAVACDLTTSVPGRRVDDNANALVRFSSGATGMVWVSQVAVGTTNELKIRVFGSSGSVRWEVGQGDRLGLCSAGGDEEVLIAEPSDAFALASAAELPGGNPWHYIDAFARLYRDAAEHIHASNDHRPVGYEASLLTTAAEGARAVAFVGACLDSSANGSAWTSLP